MIVLGVRVRVTARVGRTIVVTEAILKDESGNPVQCEAAFHAAIQTAIARAHAALGEPDS